MTAIFLLAPGSLSTLLAYIGPGPGLTMLGALFGLLTTLVLALWAVALWPIRAAMRRRREARPPGVVPASVPPNERSVSGPADER